jgi:hypothetical protein
MCDKKEYDKTIQRRLCFIALFLAAALLTGKRGHMQTNATRSAVYEVQKATQRFAIDGDWDKPEWKTAPTIQLKNNMGKIPKFVPVVEAKMMYGEGEIYVIFRVKDRYVKSNVTKINGPVSENSCVEFFFSPDTSNELHYFNLEINAGGTPLMFFITKPWSGYKELDTNHIKTIDIAHTLPQIVDPEITEPVTWFIECRIPLSTLRKYCSITDPAPGVRWKGNFYKTGSETSSPNYMTWSKVKNAKPNFHLPQFFGTLIFR